MQIFFPFIIHLPSIVSKKIISYCSKFGCLPGTIYPHRTVWATAENVLNCVKQHCSSQCVFKNSEKSTPQTATTFKEKFYIWIKYVEFICQILHLLSSPTPILQSFLDKITMRISQRWQICFIKSVSTRNYQLDIIYYIYKYSCWSLLIIPMNLYHRSKHYSRCCPG